MRLLRTRSDGTSPFATVLVPVIGVLYIFPFYIMVSQSLKTPRAAALEPLTPPTSLYFDNFTQAWQQASLGTAFISSALIAVMSVVGLVVFGIAAAFVLARRGGRIAPKVRVLFLLGLAIPFQLGLIPLYELARHSGLIGTVWGMVLYYIGARIPFTVFIYTAFLVATPVDFEEAAELDGASQLQVFFHIVIPALAPATATVVILNLIEIWNDFFVPLLFLSGTEQRTLPLAIFTFVGQYSSQWSLVFAGLTLALLPVLLVYFVLQRRIIDGFSTGLKG